jgi:hypothetical protein
MKKLILLISLGYFISLTICNEDYGLDIATVKRTKVLACVSISKARMTQDEENIEKLINIINNHFGITDGRNKILSLGLVNCFSKINIPEALEVI